MNKKPDCYACVNRYELIGDCHSGCKARKAKVAGDPHGIKHGWFMWPFNFDPVWLLTCDSFQAVNNDHPDPEAQAAEAECRKDAKEDR